MLIITKLVYTLPLHYDITCLTSVNVSIQSMMKKTFPKITLSHVSDT